VTDARDHVQTATAELPDGSSLELRHVGGRPADRPLDLARLLDILRAEIENAQRARGQAEPPRSGIVGKSPTLLAMQRMIDKVAPTQATVLVTGENGTGKELVARAIHLGSPRADKPFVAANCSAFNDNLLESELFGHRRGAFTGAVADKRGLFEEADGGTFLLDEVGDMSPALQVKLLRVLQEGTFLPVGGTTTKKVDVRIIAATNKDLSAMVKQGHFREDLYYRLHVVAMRTPPLRERGEDLDVLIDHFMARLAARLGRTKRLAPATRSLLRAHRWPGNVRELQNEIERIWVLSGDEPTIAPEHLSRAIQETAGRVSAPSAAEPSDPPAAAEDVDEPLQVALERVERQIIERALAKQNGNRTRAAQALGVSRRNLIRKLQQLGLSNQDEAEE
jgi:two-component system response regulator HupR/HoxA